MSQLIIDVMYAHYNRRADHAFFLATNNLALPRRAFLDVGGFDPSFPTAAGEDREFCDRWLSRGYRLTYAADAVVYHAHPLTLRTLWRQHFHYGRAAFRYHQIRARRRTGRFHIDGEFYLALARRTFAGKVSPRTLHRAMLLTVTQAANTAGFLWERYQDGRPG